MFSNFSHSTAGFVIRFLHSMALFLLCRNCCKNGGAKRFWCRKRNCADDFLSGRKEVWQLIIPAPHGLLDFCITSGWVPAKRTHFWRPPWFTNRIKSSKRTALGEPSRSAETTAAGIFSWVANSSILRTSPDPILGSGACAANVL